LIRKPGMLNGGRIVFSLNGVGKNRYPHAKG